jgi:hypothetical protein
MVIMGGRFGSGTSCYEWITLGGDDRIELNLILRRDH